MFVLETMTSDTISNGNTRLLLFVLLMLAIILILTGAVIATFTLINQRKERSAPFPLEQLERENI
jgi:hypothetical protein